MDDNSFELRMEAHHFHQHLHGSGRGAAAVPQKLFANWEMDRAHTSTVQRVFTLSISRLALFPCPSQMRSFVITAKLEGYKRSLRSNEIVLGGDGGGLSAIDLPLDISFTIQYPHFLKHKSNVMQIHVQRKRKYKNRPIPGGFKSVAYGSIDLTAMMQCNSSTKAEIGLWAVSSSKQTAATTMTAANSIGRMVLQSCATLPLEAEGEGATGGGKMSNKDKVVELSEPDSEISEDDDSDLPNDGVPNSGRSGRGQAAAAPGDVRLRDSQRRRKRAQHKKNMKQRLVNLLKKLRAPDEGGNEAAASSTAREPTAKELQALFDELDELSDSGNEGVAADEISIVSNPRPALRPYFSSREQLPLPAIEDERASESEGEGEDVEWSSETEGAAAGGAGGLQVPGMQLQQATPRGVGDPPADPTTPNVQQLPWPSTSPWKGGAGGGVTSSSRREGGGGGEMEGSTSSSMMMTHSMTAGSIAVMREKDKVARNASLSDQLYAILSTEGAAGGVGGGQSTAANGGAATAAAAAGGGGVASHECIWLCQFSDDAMLDSLAAAHAALAAARPTPPLHLIGTATARDVKAAIHQIVGKIQMFCNSNSVAPPVTWIGVMGGDRLVSQVLRAYVDVLQHKSSSSWLQYLRFLLVLPPTTHVGRVVQSHDSALEQLSRDIWERWADLSPAQHAAVAEKLCGWPTGRAASPAPSLNLLIGEALVQLSTKDAKELVADGNDRLFVPFLSEVRLCGEEVEGGGGGSFSSSAPSTSSPRGPPLPPLSSAFSALSDQQQPFDMPETARMQQQQLQQGQNSPPASPHTKGSSSLDRQEVQLEFWVSRGEEAGGGGMSTVLAPLPPGQFPATPSGGGGKKEKDKENMKESMKSHFKTLMINRPANAPLLKLQFVKEKKKDKMFQKLGMKNKSKNDVETSPSVIFNVSRLLCSAQGKHTLTVVVDGCAYGDVRFFATSSQWQTHVKYFPVGLMTPHLA